MQKNYRFNLALLLFIFGCSHQLPDFASTLTMRLPTEAKAEAIGEYSLGCLQGAQTFNGNEKGLILSQKKRGRYWGHPNLINLLTRAGEEFSKLSKTIIVGDLSQSRGGPTLTGHSSHQNGLDVDVWFKVVSTFEKINFKNQEIEEMNPVKELEADQKKLIKFFAEDSTVERIFINPKLKKILCSDTGPSKLKLEEQRKLRSWWGHDDHIHVRLSCPLDSPNCVKQKPIPAGDGCGDDLNWWFTDEALTGEKDSSWEDMKIIYLEKIKNLPKECTFYLNP